MEKPGEQYMQIGGRCKYLLPLNIKMSKAYSSSKIITFHQEQKENS